MTGAERQEFNELNDRVIELEMGIKEAVGEIDECDGSPNKSQHALDYVRAILSEAYGDELTGEKTE